MVAKSYQSYPTVGSHYTKNDKEYIKVRTPTGLIKEVRWYYDPASLASLKKARFNNQDTIYLARNISLEEGININLSNTGARYRIPVGWYWFTQPKDIPTIPHTWQNECTQIIAKSEYADLIKNMEGAND